MAKNTFVPFSVEHEQIFETEMKKEVPNFSIKFLKSDNPKFYRAIMRSMKKVEYLNPNRF